MADTDETQPINRVTNETAQTPVVVLPALSPTAGRHRAPSRYERLRKTPPRAVLAPLAEAWHLVWPPLVGIAAGTLLATTTAIGLVTVWWYSL